MKRLDRHNEPDAGGWQSEGPQTGHSAWRRGTWLIGGWQAEREDLQ